MASSSAVSSLGPVFRQPKLLSPSQREFLFVVEAYWCCCTLLSPTLELPPAAWWVPRMPSLRADQLELAFSDVWDVQMDALLMSYANERAEILQKSVASLSSEELIPSRSAAASLSSAATRLSATRDGSVPAAAAASPVTRTTSTPADQAALRRGISVIPRYQPLADDDEEKVRHSDGTKREKNLLVGTAHLSDIDPAAIRARFAVLLRWNELVKPCLPLIDLSFYRRDGHRAHTLCRSKGRLLPDIKTELVQLGIRLSQDRALENDQPRVILNIPLPGQATPQTSAFEQLFAQLHGKSQPAGTWYLASDTICWICDAAYR
jgi:hypothetical protein